MFMRPGKRVILLGRRASTTYVYDTFTGTDGTNLAAHTPDIGGAWTVSAGTITIQSNRAASSASGAGNGALIESGQANIVITGTVRWTDGTGGLGTGFYFRATDISNLWLVEIENTSTITIYDRQAGTFTLRASASVAAISANTDYPIRITASGNTITAVWNNNETINFTSSFNNTATQVGLRLSDTLGIAAADNFLVVSP